MAMSFGDVIQSNLGFKPNEPLLDVGSTRLWMIGLISTWMVYLRCCLSAAALYLLGRSSGRDAEILKSVTRVNQLKELGLCLFRELKPLLSPHLAEQHFLKHNDAGSWIQDSALMLSMSKEVPWYLDDGTDRVHVVGARGAAGFALPVGSEAFEESGRSLVRGTLDYLQGLKMLGVKRIERVLPVGTSLTVVGEKKCEQPMASLIMGMRSYSSKTIGIQLQVSGSALSSLLGIGLNWEGENASEPLAFIKHLGNLCLSGKLESKILKLYCLKTLTK
ncbi:hypothetical protein JHK86_004185 [Glycine max]|nr:hypothetical protein JHK86_004185 [Glycine max]